MSDETRTEELGQRFRQGQIEIENAESAVQLAMDRAGGAVGIISNAAEGSSSDLLTGALSNLAEAEVLLGQVMALYTDARSQIEQHINTRKLG